MFEEEENVKRTGGHLVNAGVVATFFTGLAWLFLGMLNFDPSGRKILAEDLISDIKKLYILTYVRSITGLLFFIFLLITIVLYARMRVGKWDVRTVVLLVVILGMGAYFIAALLPDLIPIVFNKPVIKEVEMIDKNFHVHSRGHRRSHYLYFPDNKVVHVTEEEYRKYEVGDTFYVVVCGDKYIKVFNTKEYKLPSNVSST